MIRKTAHRPLYRELLRESLLVAWRERRLWPLALVAGALQTGGMYDVMVAGFAQIAQQGRFLVSAASRGVPPTVYFQAQWDFITQLGVLQAVLYASVLVLSLLGLSVIAQGALTFGLGAHVRGKRPSFRECLKAGAQSFWPVVGLNVFTFGVLFIAKVLVLLPLALTVEYPSFLSVAIYILATIIFLAAIVVMTIIHMFTLGGIVLDEETLVVSIQQAYAEFKKSWLIVLETAGLLFVVGFGILFLALGVFLVAAVPLLLLLIAALLLDSGAMIIASRSLLVIWFFVSLITAGAFTIQFQYAVWINLFRRVDAKNPRALYHRLFRWMLGSSTQPS